MPKSATDLMREILFASVVDSIVTLKDGARGVPNALLRDINAIHANVTFADLPPALQKTIDDGVRTAFARLLKEGYAVTPADQAPRGPRPRPEGAPPAGAQIRRGPPRSAPRRPPPKRG